MLEMWAMSSRQDDRWRRRLMIVAHSLAAPRLFCYLWKENEYRRRANAADWRWSEEQTRLDYCVENNLHGYTIRTAPRKDAWVDEDIQISVFNDNDEVYTFHGHKETVFVQIEDVLYVAAYCPISTGAEIVAFDLKARTQLWRCPLRGNPPDFHSKYQHQIILEVEDGMIVAYGAEGHGRYIEYVDPKRGKSVGLKKLPPVRYR